ncbi:Heat shock protein DnaJ domain protein OS=Planctomyces limnophilus (strain ATCC 43296 / DSM 3776 / IFAM 1008 / 290) GN=Plim_3023 PE=4 SV=1: DnaJ [Gemmata massiliana]|uniref:J domain-containing protein n=1 Tax=Gemmata massiliana TaxID=1210884 RepID=A0A6P2DER7_9BACT|nr:J domain-containing protein [Gemmata massiliana]VTS00136.1 Heat shock protein DnaJ domain protein OS=Planctomyces limnophilus (strain ATCC 43296 / DSM 3776 / IFAM 1008 / 290) GN=Plim_3023 PE=4 SV=1: DnaJ [Gemmata massiliana]
MDAPPLPDDPREWPTDPFALLGVPRSAREADLKCAYTRLIRKYKPEHAPDEFRRIREAYESAVEQSHWYRDAPPVRDTFRDFPLGPGASPEPPNPETSETPGQPHETQIDPAVLPAVADPVEEAWADAAAGRWADAYFALVALTNAHPDRADLPLRLYWLLALRPTLDDNRTRHDWLAAALTRAHLSGPATELYQRELVTDPQTALYGPYSQLLEAPGASGANLLALAAQRLAAAAPEGRWAKIELDLAALVLRAGELDEVQWLGYLTDLAGRTAYQRPAVAARCEALLAGLKHLELRHSWAFDRVDEQRAAAGVWQRATEVPEPIRRVVAAAWTGADIRAALRAASGWAAVDPGAALQKCDQVIGEGITILVAFARVLESKHHSAPIGPEFPPDLIRGLVRGHLANRSPDDHDYIVVRRSLIRLLVTERVDPDELAEACATDANYLVRAIAEHIQKDGALRLVYRAATVPD